VNATWYQDQVRDYQQEGRFKEALASAEALVKLRSKAQGADHWQTVNARIEADAIRRVLQQPEQGQKDHIRSQELQRQADELARKARYAEAQALLEKVLTIRRKVLGDEHPHTATGYNNLAYCQYAQGKYA
jgi:hypothetical protein